MKRASGIILALLAGMLFPFLIWVGLFVAVRPRIVKVMRRVGSIALVFLAAICAPLLIWVGLFVAIKERVQEWQLKRSPARTISEILGAAGISVQGAQYAEEAPVDVIFRPRPLAEIHSIFVRAGI